MSFVMKTETNVTADEVRGGIFSLLIPPLMDPETIAKISIVAGGLAGLVMNVAPRYVCKLHCFSQKEVKEQVNQRAVHVVALVGAGELAVALLFYCLLFEESTILKAIQIFYAFSVYNQIRIIAEENFVVHSSYYASVALYAFLAYATTFTEQVATTAVQVSAVFWISQGLFFVLASDTTYKSWKKETENTQDNDWTPMSVTMVRYFGFLLISAAACQIILTNGGTVMQAVACWYLGTGAWKLTALVRGELQCPVFGLEGPSY